MATIPPDQPVAAPPVLFHVEEQEVILWCTAVQAQNAEAARDAITNGSGGEIVGKTIASRLITNVHPAADRCVKLGCFDMDHEELVDDA